MKVYNLGIKIQQTGVGQPAIKLLSMESWTPDEHIMSAHRHNFHSQLFTLVHEGRMLRGYAPTDPSVSVFIGPKILANAVIETTILELE